MTDTKHKRKAISKLALKLVGLSIADVHHLYAAGVIEKEVLEDAISAQNPAKQKQAYVPKRRKNTPKKSER